MSNIETVPKLLRAMATSALGSEGRAVIFNAGADLIDEYASINVMLEDVPGDTPLDKVRRLKTWYLEFQDEAAGRAMI